MPEKTMTDHRDVIEAFADNEPVRADALEAAFADAGARSHLIDVLVLRGLVGEAVHARTLRVAGAGEKTEPAGVEKSAARRGLWLTAAAAMVAIGIAGGFMAGRSGARFSPAQPVVTDVPSDDAAGSIAPAPTHVIRLENGVDWNEGSGGK